MILAVLLVSGCGDPDVAADAGNVGSSNAAVQTGVEESYALPFGLEQLEGASPIGRPLVHEAVDVIYNDEPIPYVILQAAYRISDDEPVEVFRRWVAELATAELALDEVSVRPPNYPYDPWMSASGDSAFTPDAPPGDGFSIQLWATSGEPILLVGARRRVDGEPPRAATVGEDAEAATPDPEPGDTLVVGPQGHVVEETERAAGDPLFTEQGDTVHVPDLTRPLMPTLPTMSGTGGSTSLLAADDAEAAVRALLAEADALSDHDVVTPPSVTTYQDAQIVTGGFVIPAGGWGFSVVAIRAPGDPWATLYITSSAD